jgi:signal peptidase I
MRKLVLILIGFIAVAFFIRTFDKVAVISAEDMTPTVTTNER